MPSLDRPPHAWSAIGRALTRGYRAEPLLLAVAGAMSLLAALPDALLALWLARVADAIREGRRDGAIVAAAGLAVSVVAMWLLRTLADRAQRRLQDRLSVALGAHAARLQASVATIEHQERAEYLDRLAPLRYQAYVLDHMYPSLFATCVWMLRLVVTVGLLVSIRPGLAWLVLFALPAVFTSSRPGVERTVDERGAAANRRARHLFELATTASPGKDVRVMRIGAQLVAARRAAWEDWYRPMAAARWHSTAWHALAWAIFGAAYIAAVAVAASTTAATIGDVLLVLAAGARLASYVGGTAGEIGVLRAVWLEGAKRLAWLEDYAAAGTAASGETPSAGDTRTAGETRTGGETSPVGETPAGAHVALVPDRLATGIHFERVSFAYPGSGQLVLREIDLHLRPESVVALVGENGAGKTTLVKLLCGLYRPTSGRILVDGVDLARMTPDAWRRRLAGAFQDFFAFELALSQTVGIGDLPKLDDRPAVISAIHRAGARDVMESLPERLDTQLGATWPGGVDLSVGQWHKLALARGFMRERPLVLLLDEPTASLDSETEDALLRRYAVGPRGSSRNSHDSRSSEDEEIAPRDGRITIIVSHRLSTARMADVIVVLDAARIVEAGTHEALIARNGSYARLYMTQAEACRPGGPQPKHTPPEHARSEGQPLAIGETS